MATQKQIEANRRNSQLSTGPRTAAGKAVSRANAMRSGIYAESLAIRGEEAGAIEQLTAEYYLEFRPLTSRERDLVDAIVRNEWILRRMGLVEAELWNHFFQSSDVTLPGSRWDVIKRNFPLAQGFIAIGSSLERLQRRISAVERSTSRARAELAGIQSARERDELTLSSAGGDGPQPDDTVAAPPDPGFVPPTTQAIPSDHSALATPGLAPPAAPIADAASPIAEIGFVPLNSATAPSEPFTIAPPDAPTTAVPMPHPESLLSQIGFVPSIPAEAVA